MEWLWKAIKPEGEAVGAQLRQDLENGLAKAEAAIRQTGNRELLDMRRRVLGEFDGVVTTFGDLEDALAKLKSVAHW